MASPSALICMVCLASVNSLTNQRLQAGFSLTPMWPRLHFPPESASPTEMGEDKQVDIAALRLELLQTWRRRAERQTHSKAKLTDRNH